MHSRNYFLLFYPYQVQNSAVSRDGFFVCLLLPFFLQSIYLSIPSVCNTNTLPLNQPRVSEVGEVQFRLKFATDTACVTRTCNSVRLLSMVIYFFFKSSNHFKIESENDDQTFETDIDP